MNTTINPQVIEKFSSSVDKTKWCWNWTGFLDKTGLPVIRVMEDKFKEYSPRRVSLELSGKTISPSDRAQPLICQNKLCVNPEHLVIGDEARFWAKVQKLPGDDACWIWTASQDKDMYGKFRICEDGKKIDIRAHQYSWQLHTGRPIPTGIKVCHTCDHPYCVRPSHLFLGTTLDNNQDCIAKGRNAKGETHGFSKLTEEQVIEIRKLSSEGMTQREIGKKFGIADSAISGIVLYKSWKHVK